MKYVLVGPVYPFRGGIAHYTTSLAQALTKRGLQFHVVSFRRQYPRWLFPGKSDQDPSREPLRRRIGKRYFPRLYWVAPQDVHALADAIELCLQENKLAAEPVSSSSGAGDWDKLVDMIEAHKGD